MKNKLKSIALAIALVCCSVSFTGCGNKEVEKKKLMWDVENLKSVNPIITQTGVQFSEQISGIKFEGLEYNGAKTNIFAFVGVPTTPMPAGGYPAMVLCHGGLGKAFPDWVKLWTDRGYVAIAPDLDSQHCTVEGGALASEFNPEGGPRGYGVNAQNFADNKNSWVYHSVANVMLSNNILINMPNVNKDKIGITGISWGSYLLNIVSGVDTRFKFGIPVYGAGYLHEDTGSDLYTMFAGMDDIMLQEYATKFDPSAYLVDCAMPMLWISGVNDFAFSPVCNQKASDLSKGSVAHCFKPSFTHGQQPGDRTPEIFAFADYMANGEDSMLRLNKAQVSDTHISVEVANAVGIKSAYLYYTDAGDADIHTATWLRSEALDCSAAKISAAKVEGTYAFFYFTDANDNGVSSQLIAL